MLRALKILLPVLVLGLGAIGAWVMIHNSRQVETQPPEILPPLVRTAVGDGVDLVAVAVRSDGVVEDVTGGVVWGTADSGVATVAGLHERLRRTTGGASPSSLAIPRIA